MKYDVKWRGIFFELSKRMSCRPVRSVGRWKNRVEQIMNECHAIGNQCSSAFFIMMINISLPYWPRSVTLVADREENVLQNDLS